MDNSVLAAMAKWPNVPAVFGWLRLDARGQWWLREERLSQPAIVEFFQRNYSRDGEGRFYVQNGPQKVYVALDVAPFIARRWSQGWQLVPDLDAERPRLAYLDDDGRLFIEIGGEPALVDDRELLALSECIVTIDGAQPDEAAWAAWRRGDMRLHLNLPEGVLRLKPLPEGGVAGSYGVVLQPSA
ncbi:DUF2946 family protein [Vogesella sp. LIG4]|uniref:DUF2946 family protein n=1 Tax=Vogesella sp. LIG4 TaxID=1192162 RepID=UPI00081F7807|nr:DUF2946 family protein [Vogesella sp. LIG4]SCK06702.1 Protein of unknown function [Vogesella sp. LIG4]